MLKNKNQQQGSTEELGTFAKQNSSADFKSLLGQNGSAAVRAFNALKSESAFDAPVKQQVSFFDPQSRMQDVKQFRKKELLLVAMLVVLFAASFCISTNADQIYSPSQVLFALSTWAQVTFAQTFQGAAYTTEAIMDMCPQYYQITTRVVITVMALVTGIIVTLSGMIYQGVFRNPIAAPTMLGVAGGLNMGLLLFVVVYGTGAYYAVAAHYAFAYVGAIAVLVVVLALSRLINGSNNFSVVDMLLVGSIVSQVLAQIVLFVTYYVFDDAQFLVYTQLNEVLTIDTSALAVGLLTFVFIVTFIPVYAMRFRLNALSFTEEENRGLGIRGNRLRYVALVLATLMVIAAMAHGGMVGMVALVAPFVSRAFFGAEFSRQTVGNILVGGVMVVACRAVADLLSIAIHMQGFTFNFPIGVVASLVCLPLFVWIIAIQQRTWE